MANSVRKCEANGCTSNAHCKVHVKGSSRIVHICYHHDGFKNPFLLKGGGRLNPGTGELKQN